MPNPRPPLPHRREARAGVGTQPASHSEITRFAPTTESASATVVGPDLGTADAYATAAFVMGLDSIDWIETQPGYHVYVITHDDTTFWSPGFPRRGRLLPSLSPSSVRRSSAPCEVDSTY